MKQAKVISEFAPLKAVVLAQSQFCFPENDEGADTAFLTPENEALAKNNEGLDLAQVDAHMQSAWEQEKMDMQALLEAYGVTVFRPRLLTASEKEFGKRTGVGYSNFFSRDPFFTIGSFVIEGNLRFAHRRQEILPLRPILEEWSQSHQVRYLAAPQPDVSTGQNSQIGPFIEGGDVLVLGQQIFVGYSGLASNLKGIQWLQRLIANDGYEVIPVRLHPQILHLDCALSFLKEGLMIVCPEAFLDGIPEALSNWEQIPVSLQDAAYLMTNGLPLNEEVYITDQAFTQLIPEIEKYGIKVETLDYHISRIFGGSFRCTTQALIRE